MAINVINESINVAWHHNANVGVMLQCNQYSINVMKMKIVINEMKYQ